MRTRLPARRVSLSERRLDCSHVRGAWFVEDLPGGTPPGAGRCRRRGSRGGRTGASAFVTVGRFRLEAGLRESRGR
jgi:hypothetical protein